MRSAIHIVDREGRVVIDDDQVLPYYSLTKPFIAATIFALGVGPETTLDRWFDVSWLPRAADITIGQLLMHTSGIRDYDHLPEYGAAIDAGGSPWSDDEFADRTLRQPVVPQNVVCREM
jgi:CubicO group peptidase (beta-lactamase class C family)